MTINNGMTSSVNCMRFRFIVVACRIQHHARLNHAYIICRHALKYLHMRKQICPLVGVTNFPPVVAHCGDVTVQLTVVWPARQVWQPTDLQC